MIEWRSDNNHAESIKKNSNNVNTSVIAGVTTANGAHTVEIYRERGNTFWIASRSP